MMVNCPKCGFSQPKDQYCAKCGVDMVTFQPIARPLIWRLLASTAFQILALTLVLVTGGLYLRHADQEARSKFVSEARTLHESANESAIQEQETDAARVDSRAEGISVTENIEVAAPSPAQPVAAAAATVSPTTVAGFAPTTGTAVPSATPTPVVSSAAGLRAALTPATQFRINFIEIQRGFLTSLMIDAQQSANEGALSYGVINNIDQKLKASRAWQSLDTGGDQGLQLNQPSVVFKGARDRSSGQNVGLTVQITALSRDELATHLQIDANRSLIGASGAAEVVDFQLPESFTVPKGSAIIITGVLPHRPLSEAEERLYRGVNVLKSMSSEAFRAGSTEVAIVVETR